MKIIPESAIKMNRDVLKKQNQGKEGQAAPTAPEASAKPSACDKLTIESSQNTALSDAEFIAQLKKNILSEMQAGASERKLNDLKQQIALDEYDINVPEVVRKIMLDSPEVSYE